MGLMGQNHMSPNPCASERVNGVQAEFSVPHVNETLPVHSAFALGPRLPWSNLGGLPVIVNPVIGEDFCRRHMPRIAITALLPGVVLDREEYGKGSSTLV
jgi:hypothetical protein